MVENNTNFTRGNLQRGFVINYFLILIVILTSVSLVTSFEFDNTKDYESIGDYGKVTVTNAFGFGSTLIEVTLLENSEMCITDCYAKGTATLYEDAKLFDKIDFMKGKDKKDLDYQLYIKKNGEWKKLNPGVQKAGTYEWMLIGKKEVYETIDWIPTFLGIEVPEWAIWTSGKITNYYKFDEGTGTVAGDSESTVEFAVTDSWDTGIINTGWKFDDSVSTTSINFSGYGNLTLNWWISRTGDWSATGDLFTTGAGCSASGCVECETGGGVDIDCKVHDGTSTKQVDADASVNVDSDMQMYTLIVNDSHLSLYVNGSKQSDSEALANPVVFLNGGLSIFGSGATGMDNGIFDEFGVWNASLTSEEIEDLFNNGNALPFGSEAIFATLISPADDNASSISEVVFGCSANSSVSDLTNLSLWTNASGSWNVSNFTIASGAFDETNLSVDLGSDANYSWSCETCNLDGDCKFAEENRTIVVDTTIPTITILYPVGQIDSFAFGNTLELNWSFSEVNPDNCWFEYNGVNTSVTCSDNTTTFTPVLGQQSLILYINDTVNHVSFDSTSWTYAFLEEDVGFNNQTFETSFENFDLNLTTDIDVLTIDSSLIYDGNNNKGTASCNSSGSCTLTNSIDIPLITTTNETENKTFFWSLTIFNGTDSININTSERLQEINRTHFEECGATLTTQTLNFSAFDESNLTRISPYDFDADFWTWLGSGTVKRQSNFSNSSLDSMGICLSPNQTFFVDGQVSYDQSGDSNYTERNYFFQNDTISNNSKDIELILLRSSLSTSFILAVQDINILPLPGVLIYTERFYPGLNTFKVVQVARTDDNGRTVGFFKTETVDYKFNITRNSTLLLETNVQKIVPETAPFTLTFTVGEGQGSAWEPFETPSDLVSTLTFNKTTSIVSYTYSDTSGTFTLGNLIVEKQVGNESNTVICDTTSALSSATIICNLTNNETGLYTARGFITRNTGVVLTNQLPFQIEDFSSTVGDLGLYLGWFIILVSAFAFSFNEIAGIFMINVAVTAVNFFGLIAFGPVFITSMIVVSIIIAVVLER